MVEKEIDERVKAMRGRKVWRQTGSKSECFHTKFPVATGLCDSSALFPTCPLCTPSSGELVPVRHYHNITITRITEIHSTEREGYVAKINTIHTTKDKNTN